MIKSADRVRAGCLAGLAWAASCVLSAPALAEAPALPVAEAGFSAKGVAALEAAMESFVTNGNVKGIATRLVHRGEVVSDLRAGIRREDDAAPIEEDTIYRIYSMSKPVTGVALLMLWEEGHFSLDDPVTRFIPEFEDLRVFEGVDENGTMLTRPARRAPTIGELMSHTAGFGYGLRRTDPVNEAFARAGVLRAPDLDTMISRIAGIPLLQEPGEGWAYSISVDIQGYLVEKISGQPFDDFLRDRLFQPLGMVDTGFYVSEDKYDRFSDLFIWSGEETGFTVAADPASRFRRETISFRSGGGGLVSTMDDYARFAGMLLNGGSLDGVRILQPETVAMMTRNVLPEGVFLAHNGIATTDPSGGGFGLNVGVVLDGSVSPAGFPTGSYMWGGAAGTWFWIDPANELYFIGMIQRFSPAGPGDNIRDVSARAVYDALGAP